jgi:hypothetical protein
MSQTDTVNLLFLLNALTRIVEDHKSRGEHSASLGELDYHHVLPTHQAINIYAQPELPLPVGSTHDTIAELQKLIEDPNRLAIPHDLEMLGDLLRITAAALEKDREA